MVLGQGRKDRKRVRWEGSVGDDVGMLYDPFVIGSDLGEREDCGVYEEVDEEGLGVRFVDVELGDGRAQGRGEWWRS